MATPVNADAVLGHGLRPWLELRSAGWGRADAINGISTLPRSNVRESGEVMKIKLSLFHVFLSLALIALIGVGVLAGVSATTIRNQMVIERKDKVQQIVLCVNTVVRHQLDKYKKGELSEEEAKKRAVDAIQSFRFDGTNYIFAITYNYCTIAHVDPTKLGNPTNPSDSTSTARSRATFR